MPRFKRVWALGFGGLLIKQTTLHQALIEYPECQNLILNKYSGMGSHLNTILPKNPQFGKRTVVWLYFHGAELIGWAWLFRRKIHAHNSWFSFFVYIKPGNRTLGVGGLLLQKAREFARQRHRKLVVYPWDERSEHFYAKLKMPQKNWLIWP